MSNGDDVILVVVLLVLIVENDCDLLLLSVDTIDGNKILLYCRTVDVGRLKDDENNRRLVVLAMLCTTI